MVYRPVLGKYQFKMVRYHDFAISVFDTLLFRSSPLGGSVLPKLTRNCQMEKCEKRGTKWQVNFTQHAQN